MIVVQLLEENVHVKGEQGQHDEEWQVDQGRSKMNPYHSLVVVYAVKHHVHCQEQNLDEVDSNENGCKIAKEQSHENSREYME